MAKEKQKTTWSGVLFTIVIMLVIVAIISPFVIDNILKVSIEKAIKKQLNVDASVGRVHLNIAAGSIEVNDLTIGNPPGYEFKNILELKSISIKANVRSLASGTIEVNEVNLNNAAVAIEQKGLTSNLNDILKSTKKPKAETEKTEQKGKNVHVASVDIQDINVTAKLLPVPGKLDTVRLKISRLHLSDIGGKKTTLADVAGKIFTEISNAIVREGSNIIPSDVLGPINENIGQAREKVLKTEEEMKKEVKGATEGLKGLFKKKKD